jgi:transposase
MLHCMKIALTATDRQQLEAGYQAARDKRTANRINILLLLDDGYTYEEVAAILRLDDETIRRQEKSYRALGLAEFLKNPFSGGTCKLLDDQITELETYLESNLCETTAEVVAHVVNTYGVKYTTAGMCELLKRLGFVYKKPVLVPGKADAALQHEFIEYYETIKASMGASDKIYFVDGVHPQYNSMPSYGWIKKGVESSLKSNTGRERVNINGALDPDTLEVIAQVDKTLDSDATIRFLKLIEDQNKDAKKIVMLVDNARYYYNGDVVEYVSNSKKLEFVFLPPYAPNLNLIERLWKFMKKKTLYNQYYSTFKEFKAALGDFFMRLPEHYEELSGLLTEEFQIIGS